MQSEGAHNVNTLAKTFDISCKQSWCWTFIDSGCYATNMKLCTSGSHTSTTYRHN